MTITTKIKQGARIATLGLAGIVGMAANVNCVQEYGQQNLAGGQVRQYNDLPELVICNSWNDNGDGVMNANELVGEGKHTFEAGEVFQMYGLNKTGRVVSAEIKIYSDEGALVSTSGQMTVQPGGNIWSERAFAHNNPYQRIYTVQLIFDGRTRITENIKINSSEKYKPLIDNLLKKD